MKGLIIFVAIFGLSLAKTCPPPELLSPCLCFLEEDGLPFGYAIICVGLGENFDLKAHFDNVSSRFQEDHVFDLLQITDNPYLEEIEEETFESLKFEAVLIAFNPLLSRVHPRAFNASRGITKKLQLIYNAIGNDEESGIFDFIRSFENLEQFFHSSRETFLTSISPNAFANMSSLEYISFGEGSISGIGSRAFSGCPKLKEVILSDNQLPPDGLPDDAFGGITSAEVKFDVSSDLLDFLEQRSYQPLLDTAKKVVVGSEGSRSFNCDGRADWICGNEGDYKGKLVGFNCKVELGYEDIWEYCKGRNSTGDLGKI